MILTNPGEIVLFKVNNTKGFYAIINNLVADPKKGWWIVTFSPLIGVNTTLQQVSWILDDSHIRGKEFIINKVTHQICKVDTTEGKKTEEIQKQKKIYDFLNLVFTRYCPMCKVIRSYSANSFCPFCFNIQTLHKCFTGIHS